MPKENAVAKESIHIIYEGAPVDDGTMDVRDLAPALLSIGELCQEANRALNGNEVQLSVRVKADFHKGSFGVELEFVRTFMEAAKTLLSGGDVDASKIMTVLGLIFGGGGLIEFLKWLRGKGEKDIDTTTLDNGNVKVTVKGSHNHIEIKPQVVQLAREPKVRKYVGSVVQPLKKEGMKKLEVKRNTKTLQVVRQDEVPYLALEDMDVEIEGTVHEVTRTAYLEIVKLSFREDNKWSFSDGNDGLLQASIEDHGFLEKVKRHEITFGNGDQLKVKLRTTTTKDAWRQVPGNAHDYERAGSY